MRRKVASDAAVIGYTIGVIATTNSGGASFLPGPSGASQATSNPQTFTVQAGQPVITEISHETIPIGAVNTLITISGTGFGASPTVNLPQGWTNNGGGNSPTAITISVSVGNGAKIGANEITVRANNVNSNLATVTVTANVQIKLQQEGPTVISTDGQYSEDTTIRVTAVRAETGETLTGFTGTVAIAEDGSTPIYSQNGGTLPSSVNIASGGTVTFVAKSLAGPKSEGETGQKPDDALIKSTSYPVYGDASLSIPQWIVSGTRIDSRSSGSVYDWVQSRTKDIFASATGGVATVLSAVSTYTIEAGDETGHASGPRAPQSPIVINPFYRALRVDGTASLGTCGFGIVTKAFKRVFLHEARHAYQFAQSAVTGNDSDADMLVNTISVPPTTIFLDTTNNRTVCDPNTPGSTMKAYHGDSVFDSFAAPDYVTSALEMDAHMFASNNIQ